MDRPYVEELRIQNYGCVQDAALRLTPLHALIGPNDSGKSTVLRALQTLSAALQHYPAFHQGQMLERAIMASRAGGGPKFEVSTSSSTWRIEFAQASISYRETSFTRGQTPQPFSAAGYNVRFPSTRPNQTPREISEALRGTRVLRLDPDALRAPHTLIADGHALHFADERGTGLPALYDGIITRDLAAYMALNEELTRLFPTVKSIHLGNPTEQTKAIGVKLSDSTIVPAELMSEGMLYYLAFAALPYLEPTALLLIEEPENGLHPARIAEVSRILRAISEKTQVLIATHSPLVVNELRPEEVTIVTRTGEHGTKVTRLMDTPGFEERSKVYALGELWLSYANGTDEGPLVHGGPRP
jgi:ABC-type branched-subunit amino acid transport system ATPase component